MLFRGNKLNKNNLPSHIAFIMDGNGRWATSRGLPRRYGHKVGVDSIVEIIRECAKLGIKVASFYAFSTENWSRDESEVSEIFRLISTAIQDYRDTFVANNLKFSIMGDTSKLDDGLRHNIEKLVQDTQNNSGLIVNVGINYGSRAEIVRAVKLIMQENLDNIDEKTISMHLYTSQLPDPDLVVRTSGEQRLSNFMLYQNAYAEFYFIKKHWPAFRKKELFKAIRAYQTRDRRYGRAKKK